MYSNPNEHAGQLSPHIAIAAVDINTGHNTGYTSVVQIAWLAKIGQIVWLSKKTYYFLSLSQTTHSEHTSQWQTHWFFHCHLLSASKSL